MYPLERFTDSAKQVLTSAQREARAGGHRYLGTEHLALALCRDQEGLASRVLADLGATYQTVKTQVGAILERTPASGVEQIPASRVKRVIELAFEEATSAGLRFVGTEHLLLALLVEGEGLAAQALDEQGVTLPKVRRASRLAAEDRSTRRGSMPTGIVGTSSSLGIALMRAGQLAQEEGVNEIRPDHFIRALAESETTDDHAALRKVGLTPEVVAAELTVPQEIKELGLAAQTARREHAAAFEEGGAQADQAVEEVTRLSREHWEAVSRWLRGGNVQ